MKNYFLLFAALPMLAWAGPPVKTPACADKINLRAAPNGSGVFFDEDCSTAYVLPPAAGTMELTGISPVADPEDCREYHALEATRAQLSERLQRLTQDKAGESRRSGSTFPGGSFGGRRPAPGEERGDIDLEQVAKETDTILTALDKVRKASEHLSATEGLVAKIIYTLDHQGMVESYARLNPQVKNFTRLQPETAYLTMAAKGDQLRQEQSEVLDYTVPGIVRFPGEATEASEQPENSVYFGTALSGKVRFTTRGACRLMAAHRRMPERLTASQLERHLSSNITYSYALNVRRKYFAKYNFKALFEHLEKKTKKGGFLSTKSINEVIQRNESGSWFEFHSESDDTRYPNEVLAQQLKAEMIDRVMGQIAVAKVPGAGAIPGTTDPGPNGADTAAKGLKQCPHAYCQAAGDILDFVSATFGKTTATARFLSTVGSESSETVNESKALRFIGTSVFKDRL